MWRVNPSLGVSYFNIIKEPIDWQNPTKSIQGLQMKKELFIASLLLVLLSSFSIRANANCAYFAQKCAQYQGHWCANTCDIEEVVVIGQKTNVSPIDPSTYLVIPKNESILGGGEVYRGPGLPPELQKMCSEMDIDYSACKVNAQNNYTQEISGCKSHVIFGSTTGVVGVSAATLLSGGWALVALGVGGAGAGSAGYGASACYNDKAAVRDTNLAICDSNLSKTKKTCAQ